MVLMDCTPFMTNTSLMYSLCLCKMIPHVIDGAQIQIILNDMKDQRLLLATSSAIAKN